MASSTVGAAAGRGGPLGAPPLCLRKPSGVRGLSFGYGIEEKEMPGKGKSRPKAKTKAKKKSKTKTKAKAKSKARAKGKTTKTKARAAGRRGSSSRMSGVGRAKKVKEMRARLLDRREAMLSGMEHKIRYRSSASAAKGDSSDQAAEALDSDTAMQLAASDSSEVAQIDKALQNIQEGTYGRCEACGEDIPWQRLDALPYATLCVKCKEREERVGSGGTPAAGWSAVDEFASLDSD
ncbi:MAG: TraR/DksA family transcriptional regulator [Planctomycetota bacterium]